MKENVVMGKISDSELLVMQELWSAAVPLTAGDLQERLAARWDGSTVKTLLRRLCEKGAAEATKCEVLYYAPRISQKEYEDYAAHSLVNRVYGGSARNLVATLVNAGSFSKDEMAELRALLRGEKQL